MFAHIRHLLKSLGASRTPRCVRGTRRRQRAQVAVETLECRSVPSLTYVSSTAFPWSSIAKLYITMPNGRMYVGSGAMVDQFHVLTAGHVIYSSSDGGWAICFRW